MSFKVFASKYNPSAYLVLATDPLQASECLISFTGDGAQQLAEEYALWKNAREEAAIPPPPVRSFAETRIDPTRRTWTARVHAHAE
jgi:hypothetical protein